VRSHTSAPSLPPSYSPPLYCIATTLTLHHQRPVQQIQEPHRARLPEGHRSAGHVGR
uniref:Uncharacterized protein n=1 Tax=Aegilops tauschii subsp. strangulata TaxID=200361 RepID=A0A452YUP0_AEGTS